MTISSIHHKRGQEHRHGARKDSTQTRKGKYLNWNDRILIEGFLKAGMSESNIAKELARDRRTINREVERGLVEHLNSDLTTHVAHNADRAQDVHDLNASAKGPAVKLKANSVAVKFIRCHIVKEVVARSGGRPDEGEGHGRRGLRQDHLHPY